MDSSLMHFEDAATLPSTRSMRDPGGDILCNTLFVLERTAHPLALRR
jgi:hypothetical protein